MGNKFVTGPGECLVYGYLRFRRLLTYADLLSQPSSPCRTSSRTPAHRLSCLTSFRGPSMGHHLPAIPHLRYHLVNGRRSRGCQPPRHSPLGVLSPGIPTRPSPPLPGALMSDVRLDERSSLSPSASTISISLHSNDRGTSSAIRTPACLNLSRPKERPLSPGRPSSASPAAMVSHLQRDTGCL
jgi:hypothetical protein